MTGAKPPMVYCEDCKEPIGVRRVGLQGRQRRFCDGCLVKRQREAGKRWRARKKSS